MTCHDIPEALRETSTSKVKIRSKQKLLTQGILGTGIALILGGVFFMRLILSPSTTSSPSLTSVKISSSPTSIPVVNSSSEPLENVFGHLEYKQAPISTLKAVTSDGRIRLRRNAAERFMEMQKAAQYQGVILIPISGFRTISEQNHLFFEIQRQRNQNPSKRAEVSAPPNYSEHHTGYAVDIGDAKTPATHLSLNFEETTAFSWLKNNAAKYSFELSFPPNNPQGISYEPWHWRYVGDQESLETFYKARKLQKIPSN
ncbi:M15 family metallopeptidase [Cyanobacterium sp. uoEpiScrs1]|uniref:M15 family metallopeptidase n=1 Tax=Cyanobacterium sp. uoEpiScrs1 TaxID=2976343 RepID=UPI00226ADCD5|nr:M15 family metallopeptidase [Cyanobacterium sp. uoEpiScrs1]